MSDGARRGLCAAGNWIIDHVKTVDTWPAEQTLANIVAEDHGTGGSPYNVCIDLMKFGAPFPVSALGLVGDDADGAFIRNDAERFGFDATHLRTLDGVSTSYTDVINVASTGRRTFFHHRGANAHLAPEHFPVDALECRILSLGYLLLLDALDACDDEYGTAAARVLAACQAAGIQTAIDAVSEDSNRFATIVTPALRYTDYAVINEIEAERTTRCTIRTGDTLDRDATEAAARELLDAGVRSLVVIHAPEAALALPAGGAPVWCDSLELPRGFIKGAAGAGDAFFAGVLLGVHEGWPLDDTLLFAHGAAATCLRHPTCTGGVGDADEIQTLCAELRTNTRAAR